MAECRHLFLRQTSVKFQIFLLSNIALHGVSKRKYIIFMVRFLLFRYCVVWFGYVEMASKQCIWHKLSGWSIYRKIVFRTLLQTLIAFISVPFSMVNCSKCLLSFLWLQMAKEGFATVCKESTSLTDWIVRLPKVSGSQIETTLPNKAHDPIKIMGAWTDLVTIGK